MAALSDRKFNAGTFLGCIVVSFGLLLIIGAFGYSNRPRQSSGNLGFLEFSALMYLVPAFFLALIFAHAETNFHPSLRPSSSALFIAAIASCSTTIAFCIATADQRNVFQHAFLIMGSVHVGTLFEWATGFFSGCLRRMDSSAQIGTRAAASN